MKLLASFISVAAGGSFLSCAVAQSPPSINVCQSKMGALATCLGKTLGCGGCLVPSNNPADATENSDPASDVCNSFVCPVLGERNCCPECSTEATAMQTCLVDVVTANGGPESVCSCEAEIADEEPPDSCVSAIEEFDSCAAADGGNDCMLCYSGIDDLNSATAGLGDCDTINEKVCSAAQCCCGPEIEKVVQCALNETGRSSTCQIKDCDGTTTTTTTALAATTTTTGTAVPNETEETCSDLIGAYAECVDEEGDACGTCVAEAMAVSPRSFDAGGSSSTLLSSCHSVHEAICPVAACCCSDELEALEECSHFVEYDAECDVDCIGYDYNNETDSDGGQDDSDAGEQSDEEQDEQCDDVAANYDLCVEQKSGECSSCQFDVTIAQTALAALRSSVGQTPDYSCDTVNGMICPAVSCCCGEELTELAECTLEATATFESTCGIECQANGDNGGQGPNTAKGSPGQSLQQATMPGIALIAGLAFFFAW